MWRIRGLLLQVESKTRINAKGNRIQDMKEVQHKLVEDMKQELVDKMQAAEDMMLVVEDMKRVVEDKMLELEQVNRSMKYS